MKARRRTPGLVNRVLLMLIGLMALRCSDGGGSSAEAPGGSNDSAGKELTAPCPSIEGRIEWQDEAGSNSGTEVWLLDHTLGTVTTRLVRPDGYFSLECGLFVEKNILSLHLVRGQRLVGDFDVSQSEPGVQAAFSYMGGIGFDLGTVTVPRSKGGDSGYIAEGIPARMGGGFRIFPEILADLNSFGTTIWPFSPVVSSQLVVTSSSSILQSFYLAGQNMQLYQRDLATFGRLYFGVDAKGTGAVRRVNVLAGTGWLRYARVANGDLSGPGSGFWSAEDFSVVRSQDTDLFRSVVFPGALPKRGDMVAFQVYKSAGSILSIPRIVKEVALFPPMVTGYGTGSGSSVTKMNYRDQSQRNGLTRPFCQDGDIRFTVDPPRSGLPGSAGVTYLAEGARTKVDVQLQFYSDGQANGSALTASAGDFAGVYGQSYSDGTEGGLRRVWNPNSQTLTFTSDGGLYGEQKVFVPRQVLPSVVAGQSVGIIRLSILWSNSDTGTGGGTALWIKKQCL